MGYREPCYSQCKIINLNTKVAAVPTLMLYQRLIKMSRYSIAFVMSPMDIGLCDMGNGFISFYVHVPFTLYITITLNVWLQIGY